MSTIARPTAAEQTTAFRQAVQEHEDRIRLRLGASIYNECSTSIRAADRRAGGTGQLDNEKLADAVAGLDLDPSEWSTLRWFLGWDAQDTIASIITKAREQGPRP